ncbi:thioredoxin fold domain-containing protein [uncultured Thiohalocapsa sp.]|uniref:thioredoxin fold domain-containing protein n=1 Tax=uncultured Thiohalocapsa sp. TaxID=768990 RepID=UPI0025FA2696|nr:thioredoxin fold domain-containing protein [uncultured Thiohalocapsa sp.]
MPRTPSASRRPTLRPALRPGPQRRCARPQPQHRIAGVILAARLTLLLGLPGSAAAMDPAFDDRDVMTVHYPDWFKQSFLDLPDDAAMAADAGKQGLFIFFTTQGCSYCHLFIDASLGDPAIARRLREHFDALGLEVFSDAELTDFDGDATRVKQFALDQGVQFTPTMIFYDTQGKPLVKLPGYYGPERFARVLDYLVDGHHARVGLREYLAQTETDADGAAGWTLPDDPLFEPPPHALVRSAAMPAERPLLVLFEGGDCERCPRFHDEVLGDADIRAKLDGFDIVRLDAGDTATPVLTPDGERTNPQHWYAALGFTQLPALAFFATDGRRVLETDAVVLLGRMHNSIGFVAERAYERGWNYQRYARSQAMARARAEDDGASAQQQ